MSQITMGVKLERVHGTFRVMPIYIISGLVGNLMSAFFLPQAATVGASGAIFGMFGVLLVDLIKVRLLAQHSYHISNSPILYFRIGKKLITPASHAWAWCVVLWFHSCLV